MARETDSEFRRFVALEEIDEAGVLERRIEANAEECSALAVRFNLLSLAGLSAVVELRRVSGGPVVRVDGRLEADVVQRCVVSLEPVSDNVEERFSELFAPADYEIPEEAGEEDVPEAFDDGGIDIGELVAQHLSLSLNPYPRAPGVELPRARQAGPEGEAAESGRPFAGLEEMLKKRQ